MRRRNLLCHLTLLTSLFSAGAFADIKVIVHADNPVTLDRDAIQHIYLGKVRHFNTAGEPITALSNREVFSDFNQRVLDKTNAQYKAHWSRLLFSGKATPPDELKNDEVILREVVGNKAAIGFIDGSPKGQVRVIATF